jgi:prepilin-type processing-associated H-X9-DG protein
MYSSEADGKHPPLQRQTGAHCDKPNRGVFMMDGPATFPEYLTDPELLICPSDFLTGDKLNEGLWQPKYPVHISEVTDSQTILGSACGTNNVTVMDSWINPCDIDDSSYIYFPWLVQSEWYIDDATGDLLVDFEEGLEHALNVDANGQQRPIEFIDENKDEIKMLPIRNGIVRFLITDVNNPGQSSVPASQLPVMYDRVGNLATSRNHHVIGANVLYLDGHVEFARFPNESIYPVTRAWFELMTYQKERVL